MVDEEKVRRRRGECREEKRGVRKDGGRGKVKKEERAWVLH
jgi:hypothetical protein